MTTHHGHLARYRQVVTIRAKHDLGFLVDQLGLGHLVPFHRGILGHARRALPHTQPEHLCMAFEELGATFIKLGMSCSFYSSPSSTTIWTGSSIGWWVW